MRTLSRLSIATAVVAGLVVILPATAHAAVDCTFVNASNTATVSLGNADYGDRVWVGRMPESNKIGYYANAIGDWRRCDGATTGTTDKIRVIGGDLSDHVFISHENGKLVPGASGEANGASEIEIVLDLGAGTDQVWLLGGDGVDTLGFSKKSSGFLNGDEDDDVTISNADLYYLDGAEGDDSLDARGAPAAFVYGREGDDKLWGSPGPDYLFGDDGEPSGDGHDVISAGGGGDNLYGYKGADELNGGDGSDYLDGAEGNDKAMGGLGSDGFDCNSAPDGNDIIDGGPGIESYSCWSRTTRLEISLDGKANDGGTGESDNIKPSIERLDGGLGNDLLIGNDSDNRLYGNEGNDTLKGLGGDDDLTGDLDDDEVYGGDGDDYIPNSQGLDKYFGGNGDDALYAGSSNDGGDVFSGQAGDDYLTYYERSNPLNIDVNDPGGDGEAGEGDNIKADFEQIDGGGGSDAISGGSAAEELEGGDGNDTLDGRGGADRLYGEDDNDTLTGGEGWDTLNGQAGTDTINAIDGGQDDINCGNDFGNIVSSDVVDGVNGCL